MLVNVPSFSVLEAAGIKNTSVLIARGSGHSGPLCQKTAVSISNQSRTTSQSSCFSASRLSRPFGRPAAGFWAEKIQAFNFSFLVRLAQAKSCHLLVPYGWNYKPFVQMAKEMISDDAVGEIEYVVCRMASPTKNFFAGVPTVPTAWAPTLSSPEPDTWQCARRGGGYGHGQISHAAALLFWLTPLRPSRVACLMTAPDSRVDMYNAAVVEFASGAIGTISGAATLPDGFSFQLDVQIFGPKGMLTLDAEVGRERLLLARHDGTRKEVAIKHGDGAYSCVDPIDRFVDLIQGGGSNNSPGCLAAYCVELVHAMYRSAQNAGEFAAIAAAEQFPVLQER